MRFLLCTILAFATLLVPGAIQAQNAELSPSPEPKSPAVAIAGKDEDKRDAAQPGAPLGYRALVALKTPYLEREGVRHVLSSGMQVTAEINLGSRTVLEYLLSPVRKTLQEAGRER